jgi:SET domain-containing protein
MLRIKARIAPSAIHGNGLFAAEDIPKGTLIWVLDPDFDHALTAEQLDSAPPLVQTYLKQFTYEDFDGRFILCGDDARYMNHADAPNTHVERDGTAFAKENIKAGDELTCDYYQYSVSANWKVPR